MRKIVILFSTIVCILALCYSSHKAYSLGPGGAFGLNGNNSAPTQTPGPTGTPSPTPTPGGDVTVATVSVSGATLLALPQYGHSLQNITMAASATVTIPAGNWLGQDMVTSTCQNGTGGYTPTFAGAAGVTILGTYPSPNLAPNGCNVCNWLYGTTNTWSFLGCGSTTSATVTADQLTILGNGASNNPLTTPTLTFFASFNLTSGLTAQKTSNSANKYTVWAPAQVPYKLIWSHICTSVAVDDVSGSYDLGIANAAGTIVGDIGAQHLNATGNVCLGLIANASCTAAHAPAQCCTGSGTGTCPTSVTSGPGEIYFVTTGTATTATFYSTISYTSRAATMLDVGVTASGILPGSITPLSTLVQGNTEPQWSLY